MTIDQTRLEEEILVVSKRAIKIAYTYSYDSKEYCEVESLLSALKGMRTGRD